MLYSLRFRFILFAIFLDKFSYIEVGEWNSNLAIQLKISFGLPNLDKYAAHFGAGGSAYSYYHDQDDTFKLVDTNTRKDKHGNRRYMYNKQVLLILSYQVKIFRYIS